MCKECDAVNWRDWHFATVNEVAPKGEFSVEKYAKSLIESAPTGNALESLDRVKLSVNELSWDEQHQIYEFLYTIGHRKF